MYSLIQHTHTKTGEIVWLVKIKERLGTEEFKKLLKALKEGLSGSYYAAQYGFVMPSKHSKEQVETFFDNYLGGSREEGSEEKSEEGSGKAEVKFKISLAEAQSTAVRYEYEKMKKDLSECLTNEIPSANDHDILVIEIDPAVTNGYKLSPEKDDQGRRTFTVNKLLLNWQQHVDTGYVVHIGIRAKKDNSGNIYLIYVCIKRDMHDRRIVHEIVKISKSGKSEKINLDRSGSYFLIDKKIAAQKSKRDQDWYVPADTKYGYGKMYVNAKQVDAAVRNLQADGYEVKDLKSYGRYGVMFKPKASSTVEEISLAFDETKLDDFDIYSFINQKVDSTSEKRINMQDSYNNKKKPRKDIILKEILEGKMEYATHRVFDSMSDGYDYLKVKDSDFSPAEASERVIDRLRSSMGQSHWVYSLSVDYDSELGYYIDYDNYYIRYKKSPASTKEKEKEYPYSVELFPSIEDFRTVLYHDKFSKNIKDSYFDAENGKFYVKTKAEADIIFSLQDEIQMGLNKPATSQPNSDIQILKDKLSAYEVMLEITFDVSEIQEYRNLIEAVKITIETLS